jgi:hypothetical protein
MARLRNVTIHKKKERKTTKFRNLQVLWPKPFKTTSTLQPDALHVGQLILLKTNGVEHISSHGSKPGIKNPKCSGLRGNMMGSGDDERISAIHACPLESLDAH